MIRASILTVLALCSLQTAGAWVVSPMSMRSNLAVSRSSTSLASTEESTSDEPKRNPDKPELPELKGDFDWDAKFAGDDDWITENVPGKVVLNEIELASQVTALNKLEEKWRKERVYAEYEESKNVGWVANAEIINGRTAMFFLITGLLTELWTGIDMPGQVETMLRTGGFLGME